MCTYIVIFIQFYDLVGTLFLQKGTAGKTLRPWAGVNWSPRGELKKLTPRNNAYFFLWGSVIPFLVGFCYRQVTILRLLSITIIFSPPYH
jgi:hypothetical protein